MPQNTTVPDILLVINLVPVLYLYDNLLDVFMDEFDDVLVILLEPDQNVVQALKFVFVLFVLGYVLFLEDVEEFVVVYCDYVVVVFEEDEGFFGVGFEEVVDVQVDSAFCD